MKNIFNIVTKIIKVVLVLIIIFIALMMLLMAKWFIYDKYYPHIGDKEFPKLGEQDKANTTMMSDGRISFKYNSTNDYNATISIHSYLNIDVKEGEKITILSKNSRLNRFDATFVCKQTHSNDCYLTPATPSLLSIINKNSKEVLNQVEDIIIIYPAHSKAQILESDYKIKNDSFSVNMANDIFKDIEGYEYNDILIDTDGDKYIDAIVSDYENNGYTNTKFLVNYKGIWYQTHKRISM
jgi:hypothetical protein